ncbi:MAG: branched-chain amino acid transport system II carrier protein [Collinsella sp.]
MASSAPRGLRSDHVVTVGIALFSMLFGAGNLIIPPLLALQAGSATPVAMLGFHRRHRPARHGLYCRGACRNGARACRPRAPKFGEFFVAAVYLAIGPCLAIPRTSSTAFEMLVPLLPEGVSLGTARLVFAVGFFVVAFALTLRPGVITRARAHYGSRAHCAHRAGRGCSVISPLGPAAAPQAPYDAGAAVQGFLTGYQTMDLLASLAFGIIIAETIHELGVTDDKRVAFEISRSGVIAGVLMAIIYCGLGLAGMQLGTVMPDATNGAAILARSASMHFGLAGTVVVFAIFFLACMNVCIGLISCCSRYFCETYVVEGGAEASEEVMRRPFAVLAFVFAAFSCVLSNVGLDVILMFSVPMLNALYPVAIVLVLMGLVHGFCDAHPQVWVWVGGVVAVQSVITSVRDAFLAGAWLPFDALPWRISVPRGRQSPWWRL